MKRRILMKKRNEKPGRSCWLLVPWFWFGLFNNQQQVTSNH